MPDTVFYTPDVVNVPSSISSGIRYRRDTLRDLERRPLRPEKEEQLDSIRSRNEEHQATLLTTHDWLSGNAGLEKRLARYPQFYPRIGFVHEFHPLGAPEIRQLLEQRWTPPGVHLPALPLGHRDGRGHHPHHWRQLPAIEPAPDADRTNPRSQRLQEVTKAAVEATRESLVIGQS